MTDGVMNVDFQKINSNLPSSLEIVIEKSHLEISRWNFEIFRFSTSLIGQLIVTWLFYHMTNCLILNVLIEIVFICLEFWIFLGLLHSSWRRIFSTRNFRDGLKLRIP